MCLVGAAILTMLVTCGVLQAAVKEYIDGAAFFTRSVGDQVDFVREHLDGSQDVLLSSSEGAPRAQAWTCTFSPCAWTCNLIPSEFALYEAVFSKLTCHGQEVVRMSRR